MFFYKIKLSLVFCIYRKGRISADTDADKLPANMEAETSSREGI